MKIIKPKLISGEIMDLIEQANEKMVIVSPYYHINKWEKLLHSLDKMKRRKVAAEFYAREDAIECIKEVEAIGFQPYLIKRLHAKVYFNEKQAIVSSMNLDFRSDNQSLDIAMITENEGEYNDVIQYFDQFIKREVIQPTIPQRPAPKSVFNWKAELDRRLEESLGRDVYIKNYSDYIEIQAGNQYEAFIGTDFGNELFLTGILSFKEYEFAKTNKVFQSNKMAIYLEAGGQRGSSLIYDRVCGRMSRLKSRSIHHIQTDEQELIIDTIHRFIVGVAELKKMVR
jgi:hypothetical protein